MDDLDIIVFDTETTGLICGHHEVIEIAGIAYNGRTLEPYGKDNGGEFRAVMKPLYPERATPKALEVNGFTLEELAKAPEPSVVWPQWISWVNKFNKKGTKWGAPIAAGKNIRKFDLPFVELLNIAYGPKKEKTILFNERTELDLEDDLRRWFSHNDELPKKNMDACREYFGMSSDGAHTALVDCYQEGALLMKFQKLYRNLANQKLADGRPRIQFKGCFNNA